MSEVEYFTYSLVSLSNYTPKERGTKDRAMKRIERISEEKPLIRRSLQPQYPFEQIKL